MNPEGIDTWRSIDSPPDARVEVAATAGIDTVGAGADGAGAGADAGTVGAGAAGEGAGGRFAPAVGADTTACSDGHCDGRSDGHDAPVASGDTGAGIELVGGSA
ncbi:MAG: hypothetical protein KDB20_00085, partial [Microthrixaceae bacterium]|nr:hypothetical protein [Microthrixaceae bacterium]